VEVTLQLTASPSVCPAVEPAPYENHDHILNLFSLGIEVLSVMRLPLTRGRVSQVPVVVSSSTHAHLITRPLVSSGFIKQVVPYRSNPCCNRSLVTWTVVFLTAARFKPFILSVRVISSSIVNEHLHCRDFVWLLLLFKATCSSHIGLLLGKLPIIRHCNICRELPGWADVSHYRPNELWGPHSFLSNGYQGLLPWG
jgi:hypothetical protein